MANSTTHTAKHFYTGYQEMICLYAYNGMHLKLQSLQCLHFVFQISGIDEPKPNQHPYPLHLAKNDEIFVEEMQDRFNIAPSAAAVVIRVPLSSYLANEIGEIKEKTNELNEENHTLQEKIETLRIKNEALKEKVKELENQNQEIGNKETVDSLRASHEMLQGELAKVEADQEQLRIEIEEKTSKFSTEYRILAEKLEKLEGENNELNRKLKQLKDNYEILRKELDYKNTVLDLGQVPFLLEQEIWKAVFPGEDPGKVAVFQSMERELNVNGSSSRKAEQKRWNNLKSDLKWNDENHKFALKLLKKLRLHVAHPKDVDLVQARKQLNEGKYVAEYNKKLCEEIIEMIETLRKLNT